MDNDASEVLNLLKTALGQNQTAITMVENNRYCVDVCKQLLAIPSLLRKANNLILRPHIDSLRERGHRKGPGKGKGSRDIQPNHPVFPLRRQVSSYRALPPALFAQAQLELYGQFPGLDHCFYLLWLPSHAYKF